MKRTHSIFCALSATCSLVLFLASCGDDVSNRGLGQACLRAEECAAGLICADYKCSSMLTGSPGAPSDGGTTYPSDASSN